ncbi:MAG: cytochrome c biogenesis protein DipZ [Patescibacteria group bacterium]
MLLPIIIGGSISHKDSIRPYVITASLAASIFVFTLLLKVTSLLLQIDPVILNYFSGTVITLLGLVSFFPKLWDKLSLRLKLSSTSDKLLEKASNKSGLTGMILTGAALGPVFSSCSFTYAYILTTVLRQDLSSGIINMIAYILGLSFIMLCVSILGQRFVRRMKWAVNPNGIFKKIIATIFIAVGISILFGLDKQIQANFAPLSPINQLEQNLLTSSQNINKTNSNDNQLLNVNPPYDAPEITGIQDWINSNGETIKQNKGKVILVDFWTYSCINCLRSAPYLNSWYDTYKDSNFTIIGIHAPEFAFEKKKENVEKAIIDTYKIEYPVGLDNDLATWDSYKNQFWPAKYLIDANGKLRYTHFGEGEYDKTEEAIRFLIKESGSTAIDKISPSSSDKQVPVSSMQTPETYLGWSRADKFANNYQLVTEAESNYKLENSLKSNYWSIEGRWIIGKEFIECVDSCSLKLNFSAKDVYLVVGNVSDKTSVVSSVNSNTGAKNMLNSEVIIDSEKLYHLVQLDNFQFNQTLILKIQPKTRLNSFTFGS